MRRGPLVDAYRADTTWLLLAAIAVELALVVVLLAVLVTR